MKNEKKGAWLIVVIIWLFLVVMFIGWSSWCKRYEYVELQAPPGAFYRINRITGNVEFILLTNQGPVALKTEKIQQVSIPVKDEDQE